jgi:long-chain acyl-CoA synthetase
MIATIRRERVSVLVAGSRMIWVAETEDRTRYEDRTARNLRNAIRCFGQHFLRRWWTFRDIRRQFGWKFWAMISGGGAGANGILASARICVIRIRADRSDVADQSESSLFGQAGGSIGKSLAGQESQARRDGEIWCAAAACKRGYWVAVDCIRGRKKVGIPPTWAR